MGYKYLDRGVCMSLEASHPLAACPFCLLGGGGEGVGWGGDCLLLYPSSLLLHCSQLLIRLYPVKFKNP